MELRGRMVLSVYWAIGRSHRIMSPPSPVKNRELTGKTSLVAHGKWFTCWRLLTKVVALRPSAFTGSQDIREVLTKTYQNLSCTISYNLFSKGDRRPLPFPLNCFAQTRFQSNQNLLQLYLKHCGSYWENGLTREKWMRIKLKMLTRRSMRYQMIYEGKM